MEKRGPRGEAPRPGPPSLCRGLSPTRPAPGDKKRPPGSFAGQALLSHLWYLMLPPMQKARESGSSSITRNSWWGKVISETESRS